MNRFFEVAIGLVTATFVATGLTSALASFAGSVADLAWAIDNSESLIMWPVLALTGALGSLPLAWLLGFPGAFVTLAPFLLVLSPDASKRAMMIAGGCAGLCHTALGWALRFADAAVGPADPMEQIIHWLIGWGGFHLTNLRLIIAFGAIPASIVGGCAAGLMFYRMTRSTDARRRGNMHTR